jgi:hypothetical protein
MLPGGVRRAGDPAGMGVELVEIPRPMWATARGQRLERQLDRVVLVAIYLEPGRSAEFDPGRPRVAGVAGWSESEAIHRLVADRMLRRDHDAAPPRCPSVMAGPEDYDEWLRWEAPVVLARRGAQVAHELALAGWDPYPPL